MIDPAVADAAAVLGAGGLALLGSRWTVRQAKSAQQHAEEETSRERERREAAEAQRDSAQQRKLDQEAFDRFERANEQRIKELSKQLDSCTQIAGAAVGYAKALHDHLEVVHGELVRNHIPVPPTPQVPDTLSRYPWMSWKNGLTPDTARDIT